MSDRWETEIADLLSDLSQVQGELLELLTEKCDRLGQRDGDGLQALQSREEALAARLQDCHDRRQQLLERAAEEGLPSDSILSLTDSLPEEGRSGLRRAAEEARSRARLLQHQSLTNWVLIQRSLLHLSQMIEIIATGGRMQPTYGEGPGGRGTGALVDRAV